MTGNVLNVSISLCVRNDVEIFSVREFASCFIFHLYQ
jgi:hypothetical protein